VFTWWGGGGCGGDGGGGGGCRSPHPLAPHPRSPPMGKTIPPPPRVNNPPRKGVRALHALPVDDAPCVDHAQIRGALGGWGKWRQKVSGRACVSHLICTWRRSFHDHSGTTPDSQLPLHQTLFQSKRPRANRSCRGCEFKWSSSQSFGSPRKAIHKLKKHLTCFSYKF
jgi:hypothetical protein